MKTLLPYLRACKQLLYPDLCEYCQQESKLKQSPFCLPCLCQLPLTGQEKESANLFLDHFNEDSLPVNGAALFHLQPGGYIEKMLYRFKYQQHPRIGISIGYFFGQKLFKIDSWREIDLIIPVPLHPKKENKRGYNQSEKFALGLSRAMKIPLEKNNLIRIQNTSTQTRMNRDQRLLNTKKAFRLLHPENLNKKHVLLVDDVLTTGSTLHACVQQLKLCKEIKFSMATIALGNM